MSFNIRNIGGVAFAVVLILFLTGLAGVAFIIFRLELTAEPSIPLVPSLETTFLTEPVDEAGNIDFALAANDFFSRRVTPENNALSILAKLFVPQVEDKEVLKRTYHRLKVTIPQTEEGLWIGEDKWIETNHPGLTEDQQEEFKLAVGYSRNFPWDKESFPLLAEYDQSMDLVLQSAIQAAESSDWYHPIVAPLGAKLVIMESMMPLLINVRNLAQSLGTRANRLAAQGDFDEWLPVVLSMKRLGNHVAKGHSFIQKLVGVAIHNMAHQDIAIAIRSGGFSIKQLNELRIELERLPAIGGYSETVRYGESLMALEYVQSVASGNLELIGMKKNAFKKGIDWNIVASHVNDFYERIQAIVEISDPVKRFEQCRRIEDELEQGVSRQETIKKMILGNVGTRSQLIGDVVIGLTVGPINSIFEAQTNHETRNQMLMLAIDLERFKSVNGEYPVSLDKLVPEFRDSIEVDKIMNKPFIYRIKDESYLLYSVGPNETDDGNDYKEDCTLFLKDRVTFEKFSDEIRKERAGDGT